MASLARLEISPEEIESFQNDLDSILNYVSELKEASVAGATQERGLNDNNLREDEGSHEKGFYTKKLLDEAHGVSDKNLIRVKKVIDK